MNDELKKYIVETLPRIEKAVLEVLPQEGLGDSVVAVMPNLDAQIWKKALSQPFYELFDRGGKRLRPVLACLAYESFRGGRAVTRRRVTCTKACGKMTCTENDLIYKLASIPEILHTGTLMIDDIEDHSDLRRGKAAVHKIFAENQTINCGNFLYFVPSLILKDVEITAEQKLKIYEVVNTEMAKLHMGQGMDIFWSNGKKYDVAMEEYLHMVECKTGTLLNVALQIGGIMANQDEIVLKELERLAYLIGKAFQIQDDVLNLRKSESWGKDFGEDIVEGKLTYLIVCCLERIINYELPITNCQEELNDILKREENSQEEIERAIGIIEKCGAFERAERYCEELIEEARAIVDGLGFEEKYGRVWEEVLDYVIERKV